MISYSIILPELLWLKLIKVTIEHQPNPFQTPNSRFSQHQSSIILRIEEGHFRQASRSQNAMRDNARHHSWRVVKKIDHSYIRGPSAPYINKIVAVLEE